MSFAAFLFCSVPPEIIRTLATGFQVAVRKEVCLFAVGSDIKLTERESFFTAEAEKRAVVACRKRR